MTETAPRDSIEGSNLTDFITLGRATPWGEKVDFVLCASMWLILAVSFIKVGLMLNGHLFLTMDGLP